MIEYLQSHLQWEIVHIAAYLTQRKLNTQPITVYPSEKQDNISKNKPKKKKKITPKKYYNVFKNKVHVAANLRLCTVNFYLF